MTTQQLLDILRDARDQGLWQEQSAIVEQLELDAEEIGRTTAGHQCWLPISIVDLCRSDSGMRRACQVRAARIGEMRWDYAIDQRGKFQRRMSTQGFVVNVEWVEEGELGDVASVTHSPVTMTATMPERGTAEWRAFAEAVLRRT